MLIYIGADHRGFSLKEQLKSFLEGEGYSVVDMGAKTLMQDDDYVDYAKLVAEKVSGDPQGNKGVLVCGSGVGMDIAANKFFQVRSVLAMSPDHALVSRNDDDTNVISLPADFIDFDMSKKIVSVWLQTPFSGADKNKRRLEKIREIDNTIN